MMSRPHEDSHDNISSNAAEAWGLMHEYRLAPNHQPTILYANNETMGEGDRMNDLILSPRRPPAALVSLLAARCNGRQCKC